MHTYLPPQIQGWTLADSTHVYDRSTLFSYINGAAEVFLAYDYRSLEVCRYTQSDGPDIQVELFGMGSGEEAYGIFSHSREMEEAGIGQGYEYRAGLLCFWQHQYFVCITTAGPPDELKSVLIELAREISQRIPQGGTKPHLVASLPNSPSAPGAIRYFHEHTSLNAHYYLSSDNILNLRRESRCVLARYDSGRVLCVQYTSPAAAERGHEGLVRDYAPGLAQSKVVQMAESNWLTARWRESLLIVVLEATSETAALELLTACETTMSTPQTHEVK